MDFSCVVARALAGGLPWALPRAGTWTQDESDRPEDDAAAMRKRARRDRDQTGPRSWTKAERSTAADYVSD